ncbi:Uncharacterised protein [Candidatus Burarchaeum australiense]|nr:Uncharacterised protein [Candidatus Burarchaeum australiense]
MALPESKLIRGELVLRDMQLTSEVRVTRNSLVRWLALAIGLISPNESRTAVVDTLDALLYFQFKGVSPTVPELLEWLNSKDRKVSEKALRYHLWQLKKNGWLERSKGKYRFFVPPLADRHDVAASIESVVRSRSEISLAKVKEALKSLKQAYK